MTTVAEVIQFLSFEGLSAMNAPGNSSHVVSSVASEEEANEASLSWLSPRRWGESPGKVSGYAGALLLIPEDAPATQTRNGWAIPCRSPKLAFSRAVERFFPSLTEWPWPSEEGRPASGVRVAETARLAPGVVLGAGTIIGDDVEIGPGSVLVHTTVGRGTRIGAHCSIGLSGFGFDKTVDGEWFRFPHVGRVEIGEGVEIGSNTCIDRGALSHTVISRGVKIDNLVHVAHNAVIGPDVLVIAHAMIAGSVHVGAGTWVSPCAAVLNQVTIGKGATIGMGAVVIRDVDDAATVVGNPARPLGRKGS